MKQRIISIIYWAGVAAFVLIVAATIAMLSYQVTQPGEAEALAAATLLCFGLGGLIAVWAWAAYQRSKRKGGES